MHKSYIVNRACVRKIDKQNSTITLAPNGTQIPVGEKFKVGL
jgi:DNA-binding LytR/AlgR family response regulator